ncbi:hypothetical protein E4U21_003832 [Claviceps maximensis]|nr:hypothetical protein E4U21_003832 [Claviceps maximensis]
MPAAHGLTYNKQNQEHTLEERGLAVLHVGGSKRVSKRICLPSIDRRIALRVAGRYDNPRHGIYHKHLEDLQSWFVTMRLSYFISAIWAVAASAAPTRPILDLKHNPMSAMASLSDYFNLVASKVQAAKALSSAPSCYLSRAHMPLGLDGLPPPDDDTTVRHVAVGRGTQLYTCDPSNDNAAPKAAGAVATLFNATCMAALYPDILSRIPAMAVHFKLPDTADKLGPTVLPRSGSHYFTDGSTPHFDLDTPREAIGQVVCAKNSSSNAPETAAVGQLGVKAVSWLRLTTKSGTTGDIKHVYRVDTAGGSPPATCKNMPSNFQVEYAAVTPVTDFTDDIRYWFWQGISKK